MKYKYTGSVKVSIAGVGVVEPGDIVETKLTINNPQFVKQEGKTNNKKKKGVKHE